MLTSELQKNIGQFFMIGFDGVHPPEQVAWLFQKRNVGHVILFASNCPNLKKTQELVQHLKSFATGLPLSVAIDHEGGRVHRLPKPFTHFPPMATLGRLYERMPSSKAGLEVGEAMGRELSALGVHFNFAPVLDVHTNAINKVIGDRSFSTNPEVVSLAACHFIEGIQKVGVAACGKHFPGHGDTNEDSHEVLPRLASNLKRLESIEWVPFRAAIQSNIAAIMTAHIVYDGVDKDVPATFSVKIVRGLLKDEIGFKGLVVSDDLTMGAISKKYPLEEACVRAFLAGCDLLIVGRDPKKVPLALDYFARAIEEQRIPPPRVEEAMQKITHFKERFCRTKTGASRPTVDLIGCREHKELLNKINQLS